ncbi:MAG TPA: M56 family metallopeptidase [Thermoanaerobaculia bacterium]|jgi:beta-lactamase regulating signal transducer with metallopeptidase domain
MTALAFAYAVRAALMLMAGALAARCLRSRPAALRHLVWSLVLAATLLLPLLSAAFRIELPLPAGWPRSASAVGIDRQAARASSGAQAPGRDRAPILAVPMSEPFSVSHALLAVWCAGSLILLARTVAGRIALRRIARGARPVAEDGLLAEAARAAGCRRRVRLLTDGRIPAPVTFGILRPVIVLPTGWEAWPRSQRRAVLLHELCHVARLDAVPQLLAEVVRAVHWFDPLAWHAVRRLAAERERACDDAVLRAGIGPREYATHIVEVVRQMSAACPEPAGVLSMAPCNELEARVVAILDPAVPRQRTTWPQRLRLLAVAGCCAAGLACLALVPARAAEPLAPPPSAAPREPSYLLDDPRSEIVPVTGTGIPGLDERELRNEAEREAFRRLRTAAAHVKQWEGDLVRERAEWALSRIEDGEVVAPLLRDLRDPDWRVQGYAAWALGVTGDRRAVGPVTELLGHPVWRVRAQAVHTLLGLGADLSFDRLAALAADPAWQVRIGVVKHLERRGGPEAVARLRTLADDPHGGTRMTAQTALAELGG